jgi:predicted RNase H-like HicB family nuclease
MYTMNTMSESGSRRFTIYYKKEDEGGYSAQCVELPGAISQAETLDELKENMKDAISLIIQSIEEEAKKDIDKQREIIEVSA